MKQKLVQAAEFLFELGNRVSSRETRRWSIAAELLIITLAALIVLFAAKLVQLFLGLKGLFGWVR